MLAGKQLFGGHTVNAEQAVRLRRAIDRLARELNVSATDEGLTPTQASVLGLIATRGPIGASTLVDIERVHPTMLSRVVGRLREAGLVHRTRDAADKRAVQLEITPLGQKVQGRIKAQRTALLSGSVAQLPPGLAATLAGAIPALETLVTELLTRRSGNR